jgi:predicted  nucleic acid-binding Zn-ribbon protein
VAEGCGAASRRREIQRLEKELRESESVLPADFRETYERIVRSKGADAMAEVQGEFCGGCYRQLTPNMMSELAMAVAVFCKNCGRLIYLPEDRSPAGR